jgi:hypothetical protein
MRRNLFEECRKEACTNIETNLQALAENNDTGIFGDQLKKMYPWFHFVVLRFRKDSKRTGTVQLSGEHEVSFDCVVTVLWHLKGSGYSTYPMSLSRLEKF